MKKIGGVEKNGGRVEKKQVGLKKTNLGLKKQGPQNHFIARLGSTLVTRLLCNPYEDVFACATAVSACGQGTVEKQRNNATHRDVCNISNSNNSHII